MNIKVSGLRSGLNYNDQLNLITGKFIEEIEEKLGETLVPGTNIVSTTVDSELATVATTVDDIVSGFAVSPSVYATKHMYLQNGAVSSSARAIQIKNGVIRYSSISVYSRGYNITNAITPINGTMESYIPELSDIAPISRLANANTLTIYNDYSAYSNLIVLRVLFYAVDGETVTKLDQFSAPAENGLHKSSFTIPENATHYAITTYTAGNNSFDVTIIPEFSIT